MVWESPGNHWYTYHWVLRKTLSNRPFPRTAVSSSGMSSSRISGNEDVFIGESAWPCILSLCGFGASEKGLQKPGLVLVAVGGTKDSALLGQTTEAMTWSYTNPSLAYGFATTAATSFELFPLIRMVDRASSTLRSCKLIRRLYDYLLSSHAQAFRASDVTLKLVADSIIWLCFGRKACESRRYAWSNHLGERSERGHGPRKLSVSRAFWLSFFSFFMYDR